MLKKLLFASTFAALLFSCTADKAPTEEATTDAAATEAPAAPQTFGETITADGAISYDALNSQMETETADSVAVKFTGTVQEVCQAKGCWMTIASAAPNAEPIMVRFKDYGFFMPKDISGRKVIMDGYAFVEETAVEELRHYAEDAGKSKEEIEAITEPKKETKFLASGVLLLEE
ncbi:MAG: DUF4920 domain-containing protein [Phaeodactylibacter sp.]|nr:DUF4920 domain-containing protein [Phaeodactylibacter sp.]